MPGTMWLKDGKIILNKQGQAILCSQCPCCEVTIDSDRACFHIYDNTAVVVVVTLDLACIDKEDGTPKVWIQSTATLYDDVTRQNVLFPAHSYIHLPEQGVFDGELEKIIYTYALYVGPDSATDGKETALTINAFFWSGGNYLPLASKEFAVKTKLELASNPQATGACHGDSIGGDFVFTPIGCAGASMDEGLFTPNVELVFDTVDATFSNPSVNNLLKSPVTSWTRSIDVPGFVEVKYMNADLTDTEPMGELMFLPGTTVIVGSITLNACKAPQLFSIDVNCTTKARAEAVIIEAVADQTSVDLADYIEGPDNSPVDFSTGWIHDDVNYNHRWEGQVVAKAISEAVTILVMAIVYAPTGIEPGAEDPVENAGTIYIDPQAQATVSSINLDVYQGEARFTIEVDCVDAQSFTPPGISFVLPDFGTGITFDSYIEWDSTGAGGDGGSWDNNTSFAMSYWDLISKPGSAIWSYPVRASLSPYPIKDKVITVIVNYNSTDYEGTITFTMAGEISFSCPELHIYGEPKQYTVTLSNCERIVRDSAPVFTVTDEYVTYPFVVSNPPIGAGSWNNYEWAQDIQSLTGNAPGTINIKLGYKKLEDKTATITIIDTLSCTANISESSIYSGETITVTGVVMGDEAVPRMPQPSTSIVEANGKLVSFGGGGVWVWQQAQTTGTWGVTGEVTVTATEGHDLVISFGMRHPRTNDLLDCEDTCNVKYPSPDATITDYPTTVHTMGHKKAVAATIEDCPGAQFYVTDLNGAPSTAATVLDPVYSNLDVHGCGTITCNIQGETVPTEEKVMLVVKCGTETLTSVEITVTDDVTGAITVTPNTSCPGDDVTVDIAIFAGEPLNRAYYGEGQDIYVTQISSPENFISLSLPYGPALMTESQTDGATWTGMATQDVNKLAATTTVTLTLKNSSNEEIATGTLTITYAVSFSGPSELHVLGPGKLLTITANKCVELGPPLVAVFNSDITVVENGIVYDDGGGAIDFSPENWEEVGDTYIWEAAVRVDSIPSPDDPEGDHEHFTYKIAVVGPELYDPSGADRISHTIVASNKVTCTISGLLEGACTYVPFLLTIEIKSETGEQLSKINSNTNPGLFGTYNRFFVESTGDVGLPSNVSFVAGWSNGVWEELLSINEAGDVGLKLIQWHDSIKEDVICDVVSTLEDCTVNVTITAPNSLHIYGAAKPLNITVNYVSADYTPVPTVLLLTDISDTTSRYMGDVLDSATSLPVVLGASSWVTPADASISLTKSIYINSVYADEGTEEQIVYVAVYHPYATDEHGRPLLLESKQIKLTSELSGTLGISESEICIGESVTFSVHIASEDEDPLPRLSGKSTLSLDIYVRPYSYSSGGILSNKDFDANGNVSAVATVPTPAVGDPDALKLVWGYEALDEKILDTATLKQVDCGYSVAFIFRASTLHTLGQAQDLSIDIRYNDISAKSEVSYYVEMREGTMSNGTICNDCIVDETGTALNFEQGWVTRGDKESWTKKVMANKVPGGAENGTLKIWVKDSTTNEIKGSLVITIESRIKCDITGVPLSPCLDSYYPFSINVVGQNNELLERMSYATHPELFGTGNRFEVLLLGLYELPTGFDAVDTHWDKGIWHCPNMGFPSGIEPPGTEFEAALLDSTRVIHEVCEFTAIPIECEWFEVYLNITTLTVSFTFTGTSMEVNWGDGSLLETFTSGTCTHTYATAKSYTLQCKGTGLSRCTFGSYTTDNSTAFSLAVEGTNEAWSALGNLTDGKRMFNYCNKLNTPFYSLPSTLTTAERMFYSSNVEYLGNTLPDGLVNGSYMFYNCTTATFKGLLYLPSALENGDRMFSGCSKATFESLWYLSDSLTTCSYMFNACAVATFSRLTSLGDATVGTAERMFYRNYKATFDNLEQLFDVLTTATNMFNDCSAATFQKLTDLPSGLTNVNSMFANCSWANFQFVSLPDTIIVADSMFANCTTSIFTYLESLPKYLENGSSMFLACNNAVYAITELPDTITNGYNMFNNNYNAVLPLEALPPTLDRGERMFANCWSALLNPLTVTVRNGDSMFQNCFLAPFDRITTITITNASGANCRGMFRGCHVGLFPAPEIIFPTSYTTTAWYMFMDCWAAVLDIGELDMGKVSYATSMFENCWSAVLPLVSFTGTGLAYANRMFYDCKAAELNMPTLPTTLKTAEEMFYGCSSSLFTLSSGALTALSELSSADYMFAHCTSAILPITGIPPNLKAARHTFYNCQAALLPLNSIGNTLIHATSMFENCYSASFSGLTTIPNSLETGERMFCNCTSAILPLTGRLGSVGNGWRMFENCVNAQLGITELYRVKMGFCMFKNCKAATLPIHTWTYVDGGSYEGGYAGRYLHTEMFMNCYNASLPLVDIHCGGEENPPPGNFGSFYADRMFFNCYNALLPLVEFSADACDSTFYNCNIAELPLTRLHIRGNAPNMFKGCYVAELPLTGGLTATPAEAFITNSMFYDCQSATMDVPNTSLFRCSDMRYMFYNCYNAQIGFSLWESSTITKCDYAFYNCESALLSLSGPFYSVAVSSADYMFYGCEQASLGFTSLPPNLTSADAMFYNCYHSTLPLTTLPPRLLSGSNMFRNSGATFDVNAVDWPFERGTGFVVWNAPVVGSAKDLYCYCEENGKSYPGQSCMETTSCTEVDEAEWPDPICPPESGSGESGESGGSGGSGCRPRVLDSWVSNSRDPERATHDLSSFSYTGESSNTVWRVVEGGSYRYYNGVIIDGYLIGVPDSFTSRYGYDGNMTLEAGCVDENGITRWP